MLLTILSCPGRSPQGHLPSKWHWRGEEPRLRAYGSWEGIPSNARGGKKGESKVLERLETGVVLLKSA